MGRWGGSEGAGMWGHRLQVRQECEELLGDGDWWKSWERCIFLSGFITGTLLHEEEEACLFHSPSLTQKARLSHKCKNYPGNPWTKRKAITTGWWRRRWECSKLLKVNWLLIGKIVHCLFTLEKFCCSVWISIGKMVKWFQMNEICKNRGMGINPVIKNPVCSRGHWEVGLQWVGVMDDRDWTVDRKIGLIFRLFPDQPPHSIRPSDSWSWAADVWQWERETRCLSMIYLLIIVRLLNMPGSFIVWHTWFDWVEYKG